MMKKNVALYEHIWLPLVIRATSLVVSYREELSVRFQVDEIPGLQGIVESISRLESE